MATYLIGYDLNRPGQTYDDLFTAIKELGSWWHHLDSTWIIKHPGPATSIRDDFARYLDGNDELLVVQLSGEGAWQDFADRGSQWLKDNL